MTNRDKWWLFLAVGILMLLGTRVGQKMSHASRAATVTAGMTPEQVAFVNNTNRLLALMTEAEDLRKDAQSEALGHQYLIDRMAASSAMCAYSDPAPIAVPAKFASLLVAECGEWRADINTRPAQDQIDIKLRAMRLLETVR
jgi:hypothetical protein